MVGTISIDERVIGRGHPVFVIAEAGVNHNGDLPTAMRLIEAAANAGVDAVKFQTFNAKLLVTAEAEKAGYQKKTTSAAESQLKMLRGLELSPEDHHQLAAACRQSGLQFMSTPFDRESVNLLEQLGVAAFKVSSGDLTNLPLLTDMASKQKPMIVSTGMSNMTEVADAVTAISNAGNESLSLLHCVSNYPANAADANLRAMHTMESEFHLPIGFSDHTTGIDISIAAVALGACILEKHFTLDRSMPGPDHRASLEPSELRQLVDAIRRVESALGNGAKQLCVSEAENRDIGRRSLHWCKALPAGCCVTANDLVSLRPGTGIPPSRLATIVGRRLERNVSSGQMADEQDFKRVA